MVTPEDQNAVVPFLALMYGRVPKFIEIIQAIGGIHSESMMEEWGRLPFEEYKKLFDKLDQKIERPTEEQLRVMHAQCANPSKFFEIRLDKTTATGHALMMGNELMPILPKMNWQLMTAPRGTFFITCDSPLVPFLLKKNGMAQVGGGFLNKDCEVTFPISPQVCLVLSWRNIPRRRRPSAKMVVDINRRTAYSAGRFIYSPHECRMVRELVAEVKDIKPVDMIDRDSVKGEFKQD